NERLRLTRAPLTTLSLLRHQPGGNMEVIYIPPVQYPPKYGGSTVRRTQSTHDEASRILDWNYDVAASSPSHSAAVGQSPLAMARRPGRFPDCEPYTVIRRTVTTSTIESSPRQNS